jgi:hypothetical protein
MTYCCFFSAQTPQNLQFRFCQRKKNTNFGGKICIRRILNWNVAFLYRGRNFLTLRIFSLRASKALSYSELLRTCRILLRNLKLRQSIIFYLGKLFQFSNTNSTFHFFQNYLCPFFNILYETWKFETACLEPKFSS